MDIQSLSKELYTAINEFDRQLYMIYLCATYSFLSELDCQYLNIFNTEFSAFSFHLADFWVFATLGNEWRKKLLTPIFKNIVHEKKEFDFLMGRMGFYRRYAKNDNKINEIPHSWLLSQNAPYDREDDYNKKLSLLLTDVIYLDTWYKDFSSEELLQTRHPPDEIVLCSSMDVFFRKVTEASETFQYYIFALLYDYKEKYLP